MNKEYGQVIDYILQAGRRIKTEAGRMADIGVKKRYLTEEDIAIERGFVDLINTFPNDHTIFAEEENDHFLNNENVWVIDPISSTFSFILGLPHYSIVCSHVHKGEVVFAAVYDPSVDELFTAYKNGGAFLNGKPISLSDQSDKVILNISEKWLDSKEAEEIWDNTYSLNAMKSCQSFAVNYCWVAAGRFGGIVALTKDSFSEYAGKLMIEEAGGIFTNVKGETNFDHSDRVFIGGNKVLYSKLLEITQKIVK